MQNHQLFHFNRSQSIPLLVVPLLFLALLLPTSCFGFTQYAPAIGLPMGHEWVTSLSFYELLKPHGLNDKRKIDYKGDPRVDWNKKMKAQNLRIPKHKIGDFKTDRFYKNFQGKSLNNNQWYDYFKVDHLAVLSAVMGVRWVDLSGFNVGLEMAAGKTGNLDCWSCTNQEGAQVQSHHFMRRWDEEGTTGGVSAAQRAHLDFKRFFVDAVMAYSSKQFLTTIMDGGLYTDRLNVIYAYFLLGRAFHLFQDSFSLEHVIRNKEDYYRSVREVKGYFCYKGAEQHTHDVMHDKQVNYKNNDVIWKKDPAKVGFKPQNMKTQALVATEANKDVWAAFFRSIWSRKEDGIAIRRNAEKEADKLIATWLSFDEDEMKKWYDNPAHQTDSYIADNKAQKTCLEGLGIKKDLASHAKDIEKKRQKCLYNIENLQGYGDNFDKNLLLPFSWKYKKADWPFEKLPVTMLTPPSNWQAEDHISLIASTKTITLRSEQDPERYLCIEKGADLELLNSLDPRKWITNIAPIYCKKPSDNYIPLKLTMVLANPKNEYYLRAYDDPRFFLTGTSVLGTALLWPTAEGRKWKLEFLDTEKTKCRIQGPKVLITEADPQYLRRVLGNEEVKVTGNVKSLPWSYYNWKVEIEEGDSPWTIHDTKFSRISCSKDGSTWGIKKNGNVVRKDDFGWTKIAGPKMKQISVGAKHHVWAVDKKDNVYSWQGGNKTGHWQKESNIALTQVAVGNDGAVWGLKNMKVMRRKSQGNWEHVQGEFTQISVANKDMIWGVNAGRYTEKKYKNSIWKWRGGTGTGNDWTRIGGKLKFVSIAPDETILGIAPDSESNIWQWWGGERQAKWIKIPGSLTQISAGSGGMVWGINDKGDLYQLK